MAKKIAVDFDVDQNALDLLDDLKGVFGVTSNAEVVKRALALARIATECQDRHTGRVTLLDRQGGDPGVPRVIALRE